MAHESPDRVPLSFGGINTVAYRSLLDLLGFESEDLNPALSGSGGVVSGSEKVLRHFDIDVRSVGLAQPHGFPVQLDPFSYRDEWGVTWRKSTPTMPHINVTGPLEEIDDPTPEHVAAIPWPDPFDPARVQDLRARVLERRQDMDYGIVLSIGNASFALAQRVRGFGPFLEDMLLYPDFATALLERITDVVSGFAAAALDEVGDEVDIVTFGDDMGTQLSTYMAPALYRSMVKPHHRRLVETIRSRTDATVIMHSDGAIYDVLSDYIDCGIQGINPVQVSARGMDPSRLKRDFGNDLVFWGGIDTQQVLPFGSPADVVAEVRARVDDLGRGGGLLLSPVHNIQAEVPPENILALFETARDMSAV
jgi:uroporphyrinogen decarboxylase